MKNPTRLVTKAFGGAKKAAMTLIKKGHPDYEKYLIQASRKPLSDNLLRDAISANFLRKLRSQKKATIEEVGVATNIKAEVLEAIEQALDTVWPTPSQIKALAEYYGVTLQKLLYNSGLCDDCIECANKARKDALCMVD